MGHDATQSASRLERSLSEIGANLAAQLVGIKGIKSSGDSGMAN
jgi:hypothetical protein